MSTARKRATYEDVLKAPSDKVAQVLNGELVLMPRPGIGHAQVASVLSEELGPPFRRGRGGPGGWHFLFEPELHLGTDILVPDMAGWRRERIAQLPDAPYLQIAPDWLAEVLSPGTEDVDRALKIPIYARSEVRHVWLVDPREKTLEVFRLDGITFRLCAVHRKDDKVRAEPFDAFELDLSLLWL